MNTVKTTLLLTSITLLFVLLGRALGGNEGMIIAFGLAAIMNMGAYWFSDSIVLKMYKAQEVGPNDTQLYSLYSIVENLARRGNMPMPRVYIIHDDAPNAFATGRNPENAAVAATTGILRILTKEELTGVMAHELSHVQNRDTLISALSATIAGAISMLANMAQYAMMFGSRNHHGDDDNGNNGGSVLAGVAMMILAPIAASLIQMAISRSREFEADASGAKLCGDPAALARALQKLESFNQNTIMPTAEQNPTTAHLFIVNPLKGSSFRTLFSTHPSTEERVKRLLSGSHR
ncbi:MAG: zinc metalloprotease HtpX [Gammaproteobacteria bacterium]|nr:zinc metalloprotease HtpX [Gammaproteobacteria bacterium]